MIGEHVCLPVQKERDDLSSAVNNAKQVWTLSLTSVPIRPVKFFHFRLHADVLGCWNNSPYFDWLFARFSFALMQEIENLKADLSAKTTSFEVHTFGLI